MNRRLGAVMMLACGVAGMAWQVVAADVPGPKIVVDRLEHDFGVLDVGVTGKHDFTITNAGTQPLVLRRGKSSCGCCTCVCAVRLPDGETVAPGQSAKVRLEWTSKLYTGFFRQTETLLTNDPKQPEVTLLVFGRFGAPVRADPAEMVFSRVPLGQPAASDLLLYGYVDAPLTITGWELSDKSTAANFAVALQPLTADELREEAGARSGFRAKVTVKPGLPAGTFRQRLVLRTNLAAVPAVEIPVQGEIASDLTVVGRGWDERTGVLTLGTIDGHQGGTATLIIVAQGPHAKDVRLSLAQASPAWLGVELGPTTSSQDGSTRRTALTLRIPPRSEAAMHLGSGQGELGRVVLRTNHPQTPELRILVKFVVQ